ncbi:MAG: peptidoglycan-binding protein [Hamadaea sp.]|nr:peptidoglycan-binding protein [Hamadaea sp.]
MTTKLKRGLASVALAAASIIVMLGPASPAQAADPVCNTEHSFAGTYYYDWSETGAIPKPALYHMPAYWDPNFGEHTFHCRLQRGNVGGGVAALQQTLNDCYGKGLRVDGQFGWNTHNALAAVQSAHRISSDGQYGPQTRSTIYHRVTVIENGYTTCEKYFPPQ